MLNQLAFAHQYDEPVPDAATLRGLDEPLTLSMRREAARTYLETTRHVTFASRCTIDGEQSCQADR